MSAKNGRKTRKIALFSGVVFVAIQFACALNAAQPRLTEPAWSGGQFQFTLRGETNVGYLIEASTNLSAWTPVLTNMQSFASRTIIVPAAGAQGFWRARAQLLLNAITAKGTITLGGSGRIDSFNSTNTVESAFGQYHPLLATDRAVVMTTARTVGAIDVGNTSIYGTIATGPGGAVTIGPNGNVGSAVFNSNSVYDGLIESGHFSDDVNVSIPDGALPRDFGSAGLQVPAPGLVNGTNYDYVLTNGDYRVTTPSLFTGTQKMLVTGKARLYLTQAVSISGQAFILLGTNGTASNASLEIYVAQNASVGGAGVINGTALARNVSLIGLNGCLSMTYSGSSPLIGTIYAPRANVSLAGNTDAVGAVVGNTVTITGNMGLHFDESLRRSGPF